MDFLIRIIDAQPVASLCNHGNTSVGMINQKGKRSYLYYIIIYYFSPRVSYQ